MAYFVQVHEDKVSNVVIAESYEDAVNLFGSNVVEYDPEVILPEIGWDVIDNEIINPNPNIPLPQPEAPSE